MQHAPQPYDSTDYYVHTLPPPVLKALGGALIVAGILMCFLGFRLMLAVQGSIASMLIAAHMLLGVPHFFLAYGVTAGKMWCMIVALLCAPAVGVLSVFALLTGSLAGLFGIALAVTLLVLIAVNFGNVSRIAHARREMQRLDAAERSNAVL